MDRPASPNRPGATDPVRVPEAATTTGSLAVARAAALSARYQLRPWTAADAARFRVLLDDPALWRFLPESPPDAVTETLAQQLIALANDAPHHEVRAVILRGRPIGQVRLAFAGRKGAGQHSSAEISYWLGRDDRGRGMGRDIVALYSWHGFRSHPGLRDLFARVHHENTASARLLEQIGYRSEGPAPDDPDIFIFRIRPAELQMPVLQHPRRDRTSP